MPHFAEKWWELPQGEAHQMSLDQAEAIESDQSHIHENNRLFARMYSGRSEFIGWETDRRSPDLTIFERDNVCKQVIDTASSIIAKNRPRLRVQTMGGEWDDRQRAKKLEKFLWGEFVHNDVYELGPRIFRDAGIFGTGVVKLVETSGRIVPERVLIDDIIVDERECISQCQPLEMHQRKLVDKSVLERMFPKHVDDIQKAGRTVWAEGRTVPHDQVLVVESWRRGPKGRHVICIDNATLLDEPWNKDWFPFLFYHWTEPVTGFYGQGIVEELYDLQTRLNQLNEFIKICQDRIAVPRVFVDASSKTLKVQINNRIGAVIPYRGNPPTFFTPQALTAEIYGERDRIHRAAFERIGISQLSAQSLKPAGLESAVALREFNEIEGQRFVMEAQRLEGWYKKLGLRYIECASDLYSKGREVKTVWASKNVIEHIKWSDVDMERDRFHVSVEAASILTMTPAARLQAVTELAQVGQLEKQEIRYLLNHPDLERSDSMANADFDDIERVIDMLLEGDFITPEPFQDLQLGLDRVRLAYNKARVDGAPEDILQGMREWIAQAQDLATAGQNEMAATPPLPAEGLPPEALPPDMQNPAPLEPGIGAEAAAGIGMPDGGIPLQ